MSYKYCSIRSLPKKWQKKIYSVLDNSDFPKTVCISGWLITVWTADLDCMIEKL